MQTNPVVAPSGGDPAAELHQATDVEGEVGHADLRAGSGKTDRADDQSHGLLLHREHVLDRSPVAGAGGIAAADVCRQRSAKRASAMGMWLTNPFRSRNVSFCCER